MASTIPLKEKHYARTWQRTQEEIDAYDDLMRKKLNF